MARSLTALGVILLVGGIAAYALRGRSAPPVPTSTASEAASVTRASEPELTPSSAPRARTLAQLGLDEASLMTKLRELGQSAPEQSLALARAGNERFPDSLDAAERAWIVVRSLVSLQRFHEARDETKVMKEKYPGTPWALDAERHLLVHPLDQPSREEQQAQEENGRNDGER
jgi:hypothetical protein